MLRVVDFVDGHRTIKFIFFTWAGDRVRVVKKARMTTHKGSIEEWRGQAHITIDASSPADVAMDLLMERVTDASGSGSRVKPAGAAAAAAPAASAPAAATPQGAPQSQPAPASAAPSAVPSAGKKSSGRPAVARQSQGLQLADADEMSAALASVRADADATTFAVFGYESATSDVLCLKGVGTDLEGLRSLLSDDGIYYALYRTTDVYDGHKTIKFVYIYFVGDRVKIMRKAKVATHQGAAKDFIGQNHCAVEATQLDEVTEEEIKRKVQFAAGTANHVKAAAQ
eukprot:TRINITY_DN2192_c0_g1_i1.p2 TRINITY_DN2192_c0_g1~~TRINITY_DN2192_c0_g1_i1.p2  ORF type:complete len:284 (+),score=93.20 TRINITY_DN2192_c0_g1_i1:212-1063(+)